MQIHLLSAQSSASQAGAGHPRHLPDDLSAALREHGHRVEINLLGDTLHGDELVSLREGATAGRKIATRLSGAGRVLHALDPVAWAAALTARSLADVCVVLRLNEPVLSRPPGPRPARPISDLGSGRSGGGSGRVSTIGSATERRAYQACLRAADAIAAAGDEDRLTAVRAGVSNKRALIVPDVVGQPEPDAPARLQPGRNVLSLSGIGPGSGIETLLPALRWAPDRELMVAGPGSHADATAFQAGLERLDLTDRVHWLGWVNRSDTVRLIDTAALVVLPSPTTGVTGAIEAMARSRAVATVAGGAAADVVVDGVTGSVLPAGQPEVLGRALRRLLDNPFQLEAMGLAGRERALTRYARTRAVQATEQVYRIALGAA
jgi:glycosyltransferase involved in cell wall biosynthesis